MLGFLTTYDMASENAGRMIAKKMFSAQLTPVAPEVPDGGLPPGQSLVYGLGVEISSTPDGSVLYHTGQIFGYVALMAYYPGSGAVVAILVNADGAGDGTNPLGAIVNAVNPLVRGIN